MRNLLVVLLAFGLVGVGCVSRDVSAVKKEGPASAGGADEQAVRQLCLNYAKGMNERNAEILMNMFVDDGSYITRINGANRIVTKKKYAQLCPGKFVGWDKIGLKAKPVVREINVDGDQADGFMVMKYSGPGWSSAEPYHMKFEKRDGRWVVTQIHDKK
ncbi:MAG: nuclear transport factor 2 family protein [Desulfobacterales bacterium]|nr:nuclear transport factor 2 family protein [Desulfobacterales bacterium]